MKGTQRPELARADNGHTGSGPATRPADTGAPAATARPQPNSGVGAETIQRLERATGTLGTAAMAAMDARLPWFAAMSAENRSWLGLVAQAGIAAFVEWVKHPERARPAVTGEVFGTAPR